MPLLVVQMGHVGRKTGATGAPGEQAFTQLVGDACAELLNRDGWSVRTIPADPPLESYRGDAFIAVHADGNNDPDVRGASVGYQNNQGANLAYDWMDAWERRGYEGPWHPDNYTANLRYYYGVTHARQVSNTRACIIECGTITNPEDREYLTSDDGPTRVALAIADAVGIDVSDLEDDMYSDNDRDNDNAAQGRIYAALAQGTEKVEWGPYAGKEDVWLVKHLKEMAADLRDLKSRPVADVDEAALAAELDKRGFDGISAAEMIDILSTVKLSPGGTTT